MATDGSQVKRSLPTAIRLSMTRITTPCVDDPLKYPGVLEADIRDLVLSLHGTHGIRCLASCHGHRWSFFRGTREPYVYFNSDPRVAEMLHLVLASAHLAGLLTRRWEIARGLMHPKYGLSFVLAPGESQRATGSRRRNVADIRQLTVLVQQALENGLEELRESPPRESKSYDDQRKSAESLVASFVQGVRIRATRTRRIRGNRVANWCSTVFAWTQRHLSLM